MSKRTQRLLLTLTREEEEHLFTWSHAQEREPEQQIRWLLRDVLAGNQASPELETLTRADGARQAVPA